MHIGSEELARAIERARVLMNEGGDGIQPKAQGAADILQALDASEVQSAAILSTAYLFAMPDLSIANHRALVEAENEFVSREVAKHANRLAGFCSVNPLTNYAVAELDRCLRLAGMVGIKLHFANSNVDLRNPVHVGRIKEIWSAAQRARAPIVVHMHTRRFDYGAAEAQTMVSEILPIAPDITVQIAHMAGGGGTYYTGADQALGVFADAIAARTVRRERILFDLSGVVHSPSASERTAYARLARRIRQIGGDRIVFGSDWTSGLIVDTIHGVRQWLPLTPEEIDSILKNRADYLDAKRVQ